MRIPSFVMSFACLLAASLAPARTWAFDVHGIRSGMTRQELMARAAQSGLDVRPEPNGKWVIGRRSPPLLLGTFGFCGSVLVSYSRDIYSDQDYAVTLMELFSKYGPPREMKFIGDVSTQAGGGAFRSRALTEWYLGSDRVRLRSFFDWRFYRGDFRRVQPANITFETLNPCRTE